jgi:predicted secreted hydrolase
MLYQLRNPDGTKGEFSRGTIVGKDGAITQLKGSECTLTPLSHWQSESSGVSYPNSWELSCGDNGTFFSLAVKATLPFQEFNGQNSTGKRYWEGRIEVVGTRELGSVSGEGYMELVGYY